MKRWLLALVYALLLGFTTYMALHHLYTSGRLSIDVSDEHGHGPDDGGSEWRAAVQRQIPSRSVQGGAAAGLAAFAVVFWTARPSRKASSV